MVGDNDYGGIPIEDGEVIRFATRAEFDAFLCGMEWGERIGNEQGWSDGYRAGDLVDVVYDPEALTATQKLCAGGDDDDLLEPAEDD